LATVIRGGGSKLTWGRIPERIDLVLSTARLGDTLIHRDGDLTATVSAGVRLADLNTHLAEKGQWLPVESAFDATTIGGLIATNDAGPLRHRFGTPRDLLLGVTLALTDGRLVKSGGVVVKNVAGYDLGDSSAARSAAWPWWWRPPSSWFHAPVLGYVARRVPAHPRRRAGAPRAGG
jgi:glycolate oxidase FAD binding subunit